MAVNILGLRIDTLNMEQVLNRLESFIVDGEKHLVVTANPEIIMTAQKDAAFRDVLDKADLVTPDGIGIIIAARLKGQHVPERVTGIDLVHRLFQIGAAKGYKFFLLGAKPGVVDKAREKLLAAYPGLNIVGTHHGYFSDSDNIVEQINQAEPDILLVGMGMGKQEKWIWENMNRLSCSLYIGVGGSFDVISGIVKRAPRWMRQAGLEWLYRLIKEPVRFKRMLALPLFLASVIFQSGGDKNAQT